MTYTIESKNGFTPRTLQGVKTHAEVIKVIDTFIGWNSKPRKPLTTDADKIAYFNRRSFYKITAR